MLLMMMRATDALSAAAAAAAVRRCNVDPEPASHHLTAQSGGHQTLLERYRMTRTASAAHLDPALLQVSDILLPAQVLGQEETGP